MSVSRVWIDGEPVADLQHAMPAHSRAMHYGDGLFETMLVKHGKIRLFGYHMDRLVKGCRLLGMPAPDARTIAEEVSVALGNTSDCIVKLLIVREGAGRGYRADPSAPVQRCVFVYDFTAAPSELDVKWCEMRYARNPRLAGIKHLNRLEQVMAQAELDENASEGVMLDTEDNVISATSGNLFAVVDGAVATPDLTLCGIEGVMRRWVLEHARKVGIEVQVRTMVRSDIESAQELFVSNAVRGIRPVCSLDGARLQIGPVTRALQAELAKL